MSSTPYLESGSAEVSDPKLAPVATPSSPSLSSTRRRKSPKALKQPLKFTDDVNDNFVAPTIPTDEETNNEVTDGLVSNDDDENSDSSRKIHAKDRASVSGTFWNTLLGKSKALLFGQTLSLFLAITGAIQSALYLDCNLSAPTFSMLSFYFPLCIISLAQLICNERKRVNEESTENNDDTTDQSQPAINHHRKRWLDFSPPSSPNAKQHSLMGIPLRSSPLLYAAVAFTDVYANYVTILAFKYTTITSVSLFDALAIPSAMIVSRLFVGRRYTKVHLLGVMMCCIGITINILQDYREDEKLKESGGEGENAQEELIEKEYPHKMKGDILAISGGILFGITNTLAEVAVKNWGTRREYLGCMSFFASIISVVQALAVEIDDMSAFFRQGDNEKCSETGGFLLLFAFSAASVLNYVGISSFLLVSEAAFLNLSLLTGDMWAVAFSVIAEGIIPPPSFYAALVITVSGVFIYETGPNPEVGDDSEEATNSNGLFKNEIELASAEGDAKDNKCDDVVSVPVLT